MRLLAVMIVASLVVGCSSTAVDPPKRPLRAEGTGYLEDGPTVGIDSKPPKNTTLRMLDEKIKENTRLKTRLEAAEGARAEAERRTSESEAAAGRQSRRIEELERLLAHQAEENRDLLDELLKARIMRLRMERQMLQTKLADLADEKK
ncbi:MAG: hypothetical protein HRU14_00195 [Planctomycetes bacterium]|nr:hypothetical protein [Planctomycetota bacterium]